MTEANVAMDRFMKKLENGGFKKVNQPNNGPELSQEFIEEQVQSFAKLLKSGLVEAALSESN